VAPWIIDSQGETKIIIDVFGQSYDKQSLSGQGYATPMISGMEHANKIAACPPFSPAELKTAQNGEMFGFSLCHVHGACMHIVLCGHALIFRQLLSGSGAISSISRIAIFECSNTIWLAISVFILISQ
jgi:hypothetical protein